ncbi:hypothetical protein METHB2_1200004 [Candidatus Methylobacter favarea]|uniref:Uncharacterized protein n=1 Tax=Candidatus Methylobacter favarea TaxID=2707345 RepID=A0A8S0XR20_9GAMM|nr:hypothetical protein METHB2_1200004 [Candidatus Methylobacter favarea]
MHKLPTWGVLHHGQSPRYVSQMYCSEVVSFSEGDCTEYQESVHWLLELLLMGAFNV